MAISPRTGPLSPGTKSIRSIANSGLVVPLLVGLLVGGAALAGVLQWLCLAVPGWPLHPIGLLIVNTWCANCVWASFLIGWLAKAAVIRYGGARLYRAAGPLFIGMIIGEVLAAVFWGLEPVIRVALDLPYKTVNVQPF